MTDEEYSQTQQQLILLAQFAKDLDLVAFLQRIGQAETIAPIIDPTLWIKGHRQLEQIKRLAQALRPFQKEIERQIEQASVGGSEK